MTRRSWAVLVVVCLGLGLADGSFTQGPVTNTLNQTYQDESHCLVLPEIRGAQDKPISCYCRDTLVDARYLWQTYVADTAPHKDLNLFGTMLSLEELGRQKCGDDYDVHGKAEAKDWRWDGPEVSRTYPTDSEIEHLKADSRGLRTVAYDVSLTYRDSRGRVTKVERFTAFERLPPNIKK